MFLSNIVCINEYDIPNLSVGDFTFYVEFYLGPVFHLTIEDDKALCYDSVGFLFIKQLWFLLSPLVSSTTIAEV